MEDINKLLKDVTSVSSAAEKYSKKYNAGIKKSTSGNTSSAVGEQASKFYQRATSNIDKMSHQSMRLAAITAKKTLQISTTASQKAMSFTRDGLKEMTRELSKDFGVETKNVLAMAMSRSMPIFGYALTRALNGDTLKRFGEAGVSGIKNVASSSGKFIKETATDTCELILPIKDDANRDLGTNNPISQAAENAISDLNEIYASSTGILNNLESVSSSLSTWKKGDSDASTTINTVEPKLNAVKNVLGKIISKTESLLGGGKLISDPATFYYPLEEIEKREKTK